MDPTTYTALTDLPPLRTDTAAAAQTVLANRIYARLLASGSAVPASQYVAVLAECGVGEQAARTRVNRDRTAGRLITLTYDGEAIIPTFQLGCDAEHRRLAGDAVHALLAAGYGPWDIWYWAESRNPWLGRRTPADALRAGDTAAAARAVAAAVGAGPDA